MYLVPSRLIGSWRLLVLLRLVVPSVSFSCCVHRSVGSSQTTQQHLLVGSNQQQPACRPRRSFCPLAGAAAKDWDAIIREEDSDIGGGKQNLPYKVPPDMIYNQRICKRQNQNYLAIRQAGGKDVVHDVYVRQPDTEVFWFVGKIARVSDVSVQQAVARQWPLIEIHAANLRPLELFAARGSMELWTAPGDSELEVAYNKPDLLFTKMERLVEGADKIRNTLIGFQGEIYDRGEEGFRTWRLLDGRPARPEVQSPSEQQQQQQQQQQEDDDQDEESTRAPTDEELEKIQELLKGKDINSLYEEQQRRLQQE